MGEQQTGRLHGAFADVIGDVTVTLSFDGSVSTRGTMSCDNGLVGPFSDTFVVTLNEEPTVTRRR